MSVLSSTINSGNTTTVTLTTKDLNGNLETTGGLGVAFGLGTGTSTGTFSGVNDLGNGAYTSTFTGVLAGSARTITATIGGSSVTSALPTITVNPGPFSLAQSSVTVAQPSLASGTGETVTLTVRDAAGNQEPNGGGLSVAFNLGAGASTGSFTAATDQGNGTFTATFTGILAGSATPILATINAAQVASIPPTIAVTPGALSLATTTIVVAQGTDPSGTSDVVTLTAKDAAGNRLASGGLTVVFANSTGAGVSTGSLGAVTDHNNGVYTANFTGTLAGTATTISATIGGNPVVSTAAITVVPGVFSILQSTITAVPATIQSGSTATVTFIARDSAGNQETSGGLSVSFSLGAGTSTGTLSVVTDNNNGTYTATFTGVLAGTARTINGIVNGISIPFGLPTITVTPGPVSLSTSILTVGQPSVASGNSDLVLLTTRDAAGNLEPAGLSVAFGTGSGTSTGSLSGVTDLGNGTYAALFTGVTAGNARTITASIAGSPITSTLPTITVNSGPPSVSQSTVSVVPASIQSGSTAIVTLTARDAVGNQELGGGESFTFGLGAGTSGGTFSNFVDHNNGTYTEIFTGGAAGTPTTITATINGNAVTSPLPTITVTQGPVSLAKSFVSVTPASIVAGGSTTVTLTTEDAFGNLETSGGQTVTFRLGGGSAGGSFGLVTDVGNGTYTATFTSNNVAGSNTITAAIGAAPVTSAAPTLTVVPGAFSLATSTISIAPASIASGSTATATLIARDAFGNQELTGGLTVAFGLGVGSATGSFSATTDHNNGVYTATVTGIVAGANTVTAFVGGAPVTSGNPAVAVTPGSFSLATSTVSIAPASIAAGSTATVTLTARDAAGNQQTSGGLGVALVPSAAAPRAALSAPSPTTTTAPTPPPSPASLPAPHGPSAATSAASR